ncbi:glutamyl-tRNA(Gln) amidotransferase subunit B, mitochondrial [[Candida] railenensis]|uniref:Glutamyl-tRNA(Gln) amidotransferase subunit B, mitochondrial n=1 Tax=[Candida] railenensis TaxID=45579 RepID=A0A9P0VW48_9ASCO|nr:glutamyl-tRNA(Gln) amidotransferase subunit B, mitochondrial [[Candida] railenensis]
MTLLRNFATSTSVRATFRPLPEYQLKCGLELHTQLKTKYKLFSLTPTSVINSKPNSKVSYFDSGLPGTQPKLNPEALLLALKTAVALNCDIARISSFDRKHYFYPDQPLGYQITQFYKPIATGGELILKEPLDDIGLADNSVKSKRIRIQQIQIEQDTGRSIYRKDGSISVDLNRSNTPLIELVTLPDFENIYQVRSFIKKYQQLVRYLGICTGDLETGAIRVDVNVSINNGERVEIKNLRNTTDIVQAIEYEYFRQVGLIKNGTPIQSQETRGWDGVQTNARRSKENAVDYRYFPDSELPHIQLSSNISEEIKNELPKLPSEIAMELLEPPFKLELKHIRYLIDNKVLLDYYMELHSILTHDHKLEGKFAGNWLFNNLLSSFKKARLEITSNLNLVPVKQLSELVVGVVSGRVSKGNGKSILQSAIEGKQPIDKSISSLSTSSQATASSIVLSHSQEEELCSHIINTNPETVEKIKSGKVGSIKYLIGMAMKQSSGKASSKNLEQIFKNLLNIK